MIGRGVQGTPADGTPSITYNSGLTRISTSGSDSLSTATDDDFEDEVQDSIGEEDSRPLFWSVPEVEGPEDYELSVIRRATA